MGVLSGQPLTLLPSLLPHVPSLTLFPSLILPPAGLSGGAVLRAGLVRLAAYVGLPVTALLLLVILTHALSVQCHQVTYFLPSFTKNTDRYASC